MKKREKILFITYENPFLRDNGDRIYTCNLLDALVDLDYDINLFGYDSQNLKSCNTPENDRLLKNINVTLLPFKKKSKLKIILSLLPAMIVNRRRKSYLDLVETSLKENNYDYVLVNHFKMVFILETILKTFCKSRIIYISHNAEYLLSMNNAKNSKSIVDKLIYWQDAIKTKLYEKKWLHYFDSITAISEHDEEYYKLNFKNTKTFILRPNFEINEKDISYENKQINKIIIVGSFIWKPKRENLISFLKSKNFNNLYKNNIHLTIVGRAEPILCKKINNKYDGVHMTGEVESVNSYYNEAKIAIIPEILGGGFKLKVAEAALRKTAIFAVKGAITKCNLIKNEHFKESNSFDELIDEIIKSQNNENDLDLMINRTSVVANYDFSKEKFKIDLKNILS